MNLGMKVTKEDEGMHTRQSDFRESPPEGITRGFRAGVRGAAYSSRLLVGFWVISGRRHPYRV